MPGRAKSRKAKRQEERLVKTQKEQVAANAYRSRKEAGKDVSYAKVAAEFGVKESTVRRRVLSVGLSLSEFNATKQKLTPAEEEVLVTSILEASRHGFPPTHRQIAMEADCIQLARLGESYQPVGKKWVDEFLRRHNKTIKTHWSAPLSTIRAQSANPRAIYNFLTDLVKREVVDKCVPPELLYQIDETSAPQQLGIKLRVVGPRESRRQHLQESGTKENITILVTICADGVALPPTIVFKNKELPEDIHHDNVAKASFAGSENGWTNSRIALNWLVKSFDPATREKAAGRTRVIFLDGHSSHFSLELLRKARELDIKLIAYPAHCTHILQGLDVVCFAQLKRELANEIRDWNESHQRGIQKRDFAGVFGRAYLRAFTPELVKSAWEAVGIHPYNPDIIPLDKLAPSETSTTRLTAANATHSTPVRKIMSAFSYYTKSPLQGDNNDNDETDDPFLPSFTPRSRMHLLHKSFASDASTSFLVSKELVKSSLNLIKPIHEKPCFTQEPDWSLIQKRTTDDLNRVSREKLLERCQALEIALDRVKHQIRARDAVIEASRATAAILELHAQKLRSALHAKEESQKQKKKTTISLNVGNGAVITEDDFIKKVKAKKEAREKKKKEREGRKRAREEKHLLRNAQKEAWEAVCDEYGIEKATHERVCQELRNKGTKVRDLPPKPKRRLQKEVFEEVREKWERDLETDEDLMEVDEEESEFGNDCEVEVSSFHGEDDRMGSGWSGSSGEEEEDDDEDEDLMDVDGP